MGISIFHNFRLLSTPLHRVVSENSDNENTSTNLSLITPYGGFSDTLKLLNTIRKYRLFLLMPYQIATGD